MDHMQSKSPESESCRDVFFLERNESPCEVTSEKTEHWTSKQSCCDGKHHLLWRTQKKNIFNIMRRDSMIFHQFFFFGRRYKHSRLGLTCLGRIGFNSSTLLFFILVFISCRCWRTALSLGPIQVVSLLGFRTLGTSLAASSGTAASIASSENKKGGLIGDLT